MLFFNFGRWARQANRPKRALKRGVGSFLDGQDGSPKQGLQQLILNHHATLAEVERVFGCAIPTLTNKDDAFAVSIVTKLHDCILEPTTTTFEGELFG